MKCVCVYVRVCACGGQSPHEMILKYFVVIKENHLHEEK